MSEEFDDLDLEEDPENEPSEKYPMPDFSNKARIFRFEPGVERVDLGKSSGYWLMSDRRRCISEFSVDRLGQVFETYIFSTIDIGPCDPRFLFQQVKAAHSSYEHDPDMKLSATHVLDDHGNEFWALDVRIADRIQVYRKRQPFWQWFKTRDIRIVNWSLFQSYRTAQKYKTPFLLIEGETGDPSWGDSDFFRCLPVASAPELRQRLDALPNKAPISNYAKFNEGIIDARDFDRPFNESVYTLAKDWTF